MWQVHPNKPNIYFINPAVFCKFKNKLEGVKAGMQNPFHKVIMNTCFSHIISPKNAYAQAFEALDRLKKEFGAWHGFIEVVRGFQRNLLELLAFAEWWHNVEQGEQFCSPFRAPTHRSIFDDGDLYANHAHWSITSYLIILNNCFVDPNKRVNLSPRNMS